MQHTFTDVSGFMLAMCGPWTELEQDDKTRHDAIKARLGSLYARVHAAIDQPVTVIDRDRFGTSLRIGFVREPGLEMFVSPEDVLLHLRCCVTTMLHVQLRFVDDVWQSWLRDGSIRDDASNSFWLHLDTPRLEVFAGYNDVSRWATAGGYVRPVQIAEQLLRHDILLV